ncbi:MAG: Fe-S cluster assembly protein SufD, partial [Hyphomicrobiales bacterium]
LRHLVEVGKNASLTLLETHAAPDGNDEYLASSVVDARVLDGGKLTRIKVQDEAKGAVHYARLLSHLGAEAKLRDFTLTLGGGIVRNEASVDFGGTQGDAHVSGAYFLNGRQHCDSSVRIDHRVPECVSSQQFRGVVDGRAEGVFQGLVRVAPHAQKTDGRQMVRALLLSEGAAHFAKPELEIFADDVQCAHGATAGEIDGEALFFLRARGIPEQQAKALLITAFIGEALDDIEDDEIRERLAMLSSQWLASQEGA